MIHGTLPVKTIPESARYNGTYILGAKGSGKSTLAAYLAWQDYLRELPQIIIDPLGVGTIDSFLWRFWRFLKEIPQCFRASYWDRIIYVNVAATDYITPFPLIYQTGRERSLLEVAERYLQTILLSSPWLMHAQVQGWPPLHYIGSQTAIVLAALKYPLTAAIDLLRHPEDWERSGKFAEAITRYPEAAPAVAFFREEYIPAGQANRRRLLNPYFDKVFIFALDPNLRAMFGATKPGIDFEAVERNGQTVLLDFRQESNPELRRFKLLWIFSAIYEYIRLRGRRDTPLGLIIDEFAALTQHLPTGENPLAELLDEFINVYMRNHRIAFTCCHQSLFQLDERLRNTLVSLGTYVIGRAATMPEARILADLLYKRNPYRVKHERKVWGRYDTLGNYHASSHPADTPYFVLDQEPEFLSLEEQQELSAVPITNLGLYSFLLRPALREGEVSQAVYPISIANCVRDSATGAFVFPDPAVLSDVRALLAATSGTPIATLLAAQDTYTALGERPQIRQAISPSPVAAMPAAPRYRRRVAET